MSASSLKQFPLFLNTGCSLWHKYLYPVSGDTMCSVSAVLKHFSELCWCWLSAWFYPDINPVKMSRWSLSRNQSQICGDFSMGTEWSILTWGDNRWPPPQDCPSLVWTLWTLRLKQHSPGNKLSGSDGREGPNLPWQTHLISDATLPSPCHGTVRILWEWDYIILTPDSWHTNPRTEGLQGPLIFYSR